MKLSVIIHNSALDFGVVTPPTPVNARKIYETRLRQHAERAGLDEVVLALIPEHETHDCINAMACENAVCGRQMVVINLAYCEALSEEAVDAVIAHEVSHLEQRDYLMSRPMRLLDKACWKLFLSPLLSPSWRREYRADAYALRAVGAEKMEAFFTEVLKKEGSSQHHPSAKKRRRRIEKLIKADALTACPALEPGGAFA